MLALISDAAVLAGDFEAGQDTLVRLAQLAPQRAEVQARLGVVEAVRGDLTNAIRTLETALAHDPTLDRARLALALTSLQAGDFDAALAGAAWFIEATPGLATGYVLAALAYVGQGEVDLARQRLAEALGVDPDNRSLRTWRSRTAISRRPDRISTQR